MFLCDVSQFTGQQLGDPCPETAAATANTDAIILIDNSCGLSKVECDAQLDIVWNMVLTVGSLENMARIGMAEYGDTTTSLVLYEYIYCTLSTVHDSIEP